MRVLALTHAHLNPSGLSPVSCERADSIIKSWSEKLGWSITVVWTERTLWQGPWEAGRGIKGIGILKIDAGDLLKGEPVLFSKEALQLFKRRAYPTLLKYIFRKSFDKGISFLASYNFELREEILRAKTWSKKILRHLSNNEGYDFVFCCVGYGDEYLLETAYKISLKLNVPMVVDFRDLWSEHHENRFQGKFFRQIRKFEKKVLKNAAIVSTPQKQDCELLQRWCPSPVYQLPHAAFKDTDWKDGVSVNTKLILTYAGKAYLKGNGIKNIISLAKALQVKSTIPFEIKIFTDNTSSVEELIENSDLSNIIKVYGWLSPSALWAELRSSHILLITDSGIAANRTLIPTKTFLFALTGRKLLFLLNFEDQAIVEFIKKYQCGEVFTDPDLASQWIYNELTNTGLLEMGLPDIRSDIPERLAVAAAYGTHISKMAANHKINKP